MPDPTFCIPQAIGPATFDSVVLLSEGQRQADVANAEARRKIWFYGEDASPSMQDIFDAAIRAAHIAHYRRIVAAGLQYGISTEAARAALRDLRAVD